MTFSGLDPAWGARVIPLSEVVRKLADLGTDVRVVTRPDHLNEPFARRLSSASASTISFLKRRNLHEKGVLGDDFHLGGSMNLTYMGVEINEEALVFDTDPDTVARAHREYAHRYRVEDDTE